MSRTLAAFVMVMCVGATSVWGDSTDRTSSEDSDQYRTVTVTLKGTDLDKDAKGKITITLACNIGEGHPRIQLRVEKVVPKATYSLWLLKYDVEKKKIVRQDRIDDPRRILKADQRGKLALTLTTNLRPCPHHTEYTHVHIRYHADGNPRNTKDAKTALKGNIPPATNKE